MPRLASFRIAALEDLAAQLRYAPREALLRQLKRIEELASEADPELNYPEDWLIFRITGYRPDLSNPAMFAGAALLGDLSALVERLSDEARLTEADLAGGARPGGLGVEELCERWSVSRRTLDRWRRQGLIAHRVRDAGGASRLLFSASSVEAFEAKRKGLIERAAEYSRTPDATEQRIAEMAARAHRRFGWTLNEAAKHISGRVGRSHETVRQILKKHDAASEKPIFADQGPLTTRERRVIYRASRRGVEPAVIAERYGRTRASVHRVVNERRAELLRRLELPAPPGAHGAPDAAEARIMLAALESPHACAGLGAPVERTAAEFAAAPPPDPAGGRARELALAMAHRALLRRAGGVLGSGRSRSLRATDLDRIETDLRWAAMLSVELVRPQRRLALQTIEAQLGRPLLELPAERVRMLHAIAMDALIAAAAAFDATKGGRLAASSGMAVNRAIARGAAVGAGMEDAPAGRARRSHVAPIELFDWSRRVAPWQTWLDPDPRLRRWILELPAPDGAVAAARFGLLGSRPMTLEETGRALGMTVPRAGAAERRAVRAARAMDVERAVARPGG